MGRRGRDSAMSTAVMFVLLLGLNVSLATYNPAYHPQGGSAIHHHVDPHDYEYEYEYNNEYHSGQTPVPTVPPRGGSTLVASETPNEMMMEAAPEEPNQYKPPKVLLKHMAMALRLTSEWNRRLMEGVNHFKRFIGKRSGAHKMVQNNHPQQPLGFGSHPVNVHPSRAWQPPIQESQMMVPADDLTLFHAKAPRESTSKAKQRRGVARWGPELEPFLEHVVDMLGTTDGVEIPLAMIYMDRACSVETTRSNNVPACPYCTPRTVHRLSLVALLLAKQAVEGTDSLDEYYEKIESLGIPQIQLQQMVEWMKGALGDQGLFVTVEEMRDWGHNWDAIFFPKQHQQQHLAYDQEQYHHHHHNHYHAPQELIPYSTDMA